MINIAQQHKGGLVACRRVLCGGMLVQGREKMEQENVFLTFGEER